MQRAPISLPNDLVQRLSRGISPIARRHGWRLVVLFGSAAAGGPARDLDLAVLPKAVPSLLEQGAWLASLEAQLAPWPIDLLVLRDAMPPVLRFEVFRRGLCLYELESGLFGREQDRAFFLYADSEWIRSQMREVLYAHPQP